MTRAMRNLHRFAVAFQAVAVVFFVWVYSVMQSPGWLVLAGWSLFYGAWSYTVLRAERKGGVRL